MAIQLTEQNRKHINNLIINVYCHNAFTEKARAMKKGKHEKKQEKETT